MPTNAFKMPYSCRRLLLALTLTTSASLSTNVVAESQPLFDYARVVSAEPIYRTYEHRTPRKTCWTETVRTETHYPSQHARHNSATGTIVGGIIGGAIGHAVGNGKSNKKLGAVVGSVLGMSIGNDISKRRADQRHYHQGYHADYNTGYNTDYNNGYSDVRYEDLERCDVSYNTETEERLVGYDVAYKYKGETYYTRTDEHPGRKIKVAVSVRPVLD